MQTIDIAEYRVTEKPNIVLANLGRLYRAANSILHSSDIHAVFDPRDFFTALADCPAWSICVFLAFDRSTVWRKSVNVLDKVIVWNKRISPWVRSGNDEIDRSRKRILRSDAEAYAGITHTAILQLIGDLAGLRRSRNEAHRTAKNQEKRGKEYLTRSHNSGIGLTRHETAPFP